MFDYFLTSLVLVINLVVSHLFQVNEIIVPQRTPGSGERYK